MTFKRLFIVSALAIILAGIASFSVAGQDQDPQPDTPAAPSDTFLTDDLIVYGSECIGQDCVNGENFSFDTLRLKENNLRIHFFDTSNSGSFPSTDWRITINDTFNGGDNYFSIDNATANTSLLRIMADGNVGIGTTSPSERLHVNGNVTVEGVVNQVSDVNVKENFTAVSPQEILMRLNELNITSWNYISDPDSTHIGPTAQDFYAAFGVGVDDQHISSIDTGGVALVAIQALNQQLLAQNATIEQLTEQNERLQQQNADIMARLDALEAMLNNPSQDQ
ncbi:MAG: tail fiber domain-containing protein [Ardenticatenaceae bacterium]|nr:tail fiber domain-containing protein [Ardenticatenaceae bacterium]MCB8946495.1 tail fiber domain-containing protein [Ardenticatenaceae bacterium]